MKRKGTSKRTRSTFRKSSGTSSKKLLRFADLELLGIVGQLAATEATN